MALFNIFHTNKRTNEDRRTSGNTGDNVGMDGYNNKTRAVWCEFQKYQEREIVNLFNAGVISRDDMIACYEALAHAGKWARDPEHMVTLTTLHAAYSDYLFAGAQIAYRMR